MSAPGRSPIPTLRDVADEAGVSVATASRVLNGSTRRVAESYGERVRAAADKLGYSPNLSAQATARGTSSIVVLVVRDIADPYFSGIAAGVAKEAHAWGLTLTIAATGRDADDEVTALRALRGLRPRAVILASSRSDDAGHDLVRAELDEISVHGGHVVTLGEGLEGYRTVALDNAGAAKRLGAQLAARGYRSCVVVTGPSHLRTIRDREGGFVAGFTSGGGVITRMLPTDLTRESAVAALSPSILAEIEPGTLVFGVTDIIAIGLLSALRAAGRAVGDDIALAGFGDTPSSRDVTPALSTVGVPLEELGRLCLRAAIDGDGDAADPAPEFDVYLRDSTPPRTVTA